MDREEEHVERVGNYRWKQGPNTYQLTDIPTDPCHECGAEIPDGTYCYFREGPVADNGFDHVCWDCGKEVTDFGDE